MDRDLHELTTRELRERLRERLPARVPVPTDVRIGPFPEDVTARIRHAFPTSPCPAAVLIPLVDRGDEINVLLTYRASDLEHHAGQISFPGGRLEPGDLDAEAGALRETEEEIGLDREFIEIIGRLPDHIIISGFQVTPVVALVRPGFELRPDPTEVAGIFEAPLRHLFDPRTYFPRTLRIANEDLMVYDLPWQEHRIWGATAGMILTLAAVPGAVTTVPVARLLEIMAKLRDPEDGCPWDLEQDFRSIAPYTLEEAYEVADAIERGDLGDLQEELGDLLLQVVFHAQMARELGAFGFEDVVAGICNKLVRRHPHVFAGATVESAAAQTESWERLKAEEKAARGRAGALDDVPVALPALTRAAKLGRRAARVGFDWPDATGPRRKVDEELQELDSAIAGDEDPDAVEAEFGDLLFALVNYARHLGIDPESALRGSNEKFVRRFRPGRGPRGRCQEQPWRRPGSSSSIDGGRRPSGRNANLDAFRTGSSGVGLQSTHARSARPGPRPRLARRFGLGGRLVVSSCRACLAWRPGPKQLTLDEAVQQAEKRYKARAVRAEEREENGRLVYHIRLLSEDGRVFDITVDAATGRME